MHHKNLLPILALLLLVGCTSEPTPPTELERCIEANYAELTTHETEEEFVAPKLKSEIDSFIKELREDPEWLRLKEEDMKNYEACTARNDILWEESGADRLEFSDDWPDDREDCWELYEVTKIGVQLIYVKGLEKEYEEVMGRLEKELTDLEEKHKGEYRQTVAEEYYGPEESKKREKVAERICNAQGIY